MFQLRDTEVVAHVHDRVLRRQRVAVEAGKQLSQVREELRLQAARCQSGGKTFRQNQIR